MGAGRDATPGDDTDAGRHVSGGITGVIVGYVRTTNGDSAVDELLQEAGVPHSAEVLGDPSEWFGYDVALRLFDAACTVTGDPDVARKIGAHVLQQHSGTEVAALLRSLGSTKELLKNVAATASKYSAVTTMDVVELADDAASVAAITRSGIVRHRLFCDYTAGILSQASVLFGLEPADVDEVECQTRGDDRCLYCIRWSADGDAPPEQRIRYLEHQLQGLSSRLEALQATATAFITAPSTDDVLATIARRAGLAVRAPRFLLAVKLPSEPSLRVHHQGFTSDAKAQAVAREVLSGAAAGRASHLVVDVASSRSRFGVLAAIHPEGMSFLPQERQLLDAYAAHAAAALEVSAALEDARRQNGTARALLSFGRSLAEVATVDEIVDRLTEAMPAIVECDTGAVLLWDEDRQAMQLRTTFGLSPEVAASFEGLEVHAADTPAIVDLVSKHEPYFIDPSTDDPFLAGLLAVARMQSAAIVPIVAQGHVLGVVAVGRTSERIRTDADALERLRGIADLAATAFGNARFLERLQLEALQDPLTGLANARLLARAADRAIERTQTSAEAGGVALLFVDLDGFKPVNDALGHDAGDEVLRACGRRLKDGVRDSDIVARIGGDEFVVLMPHADQDSAEVTAERLRSLLLAPIDVAGRRVELSGSVGVALAAPGDDFRTLLKRADTAMYTAKRRRDERR
jgi:diguanylate cyclase (GGDEF)-like protein